MQKERILKSDKLKNKRISFGGRHGYLDMRFALVVLVLRVLVRFTSDC